MQSIDSLKLLFYVGIPFLLILTLFLMLILKLIPGKTRIYTRKIIDFIFLDTISRVFVASYLSLCIDAEIKVWPPCTKMKFMSLGLVTVLPIFLLIFLCLGRTKSLLEPQFKKTFGSLYPDCDIQRSFWSRFVVPIFFFRRFCLVHLINKRFHFSTSFVTLLSMMQLLFWLGVKPIRSLLVREVYNEVSLFILSFAIPLFTEYVPSPTTKDKVGYFVILLVCCLILFNFADTAISDVAPAIRRHYRRYQYRKKQNKN